MSDDGWHATVARGQTAFSRRRTTLQAGALLVISDRQATGDDDQGADIDPQPSSTAQTMAV